MARIETAPLARRDLAEIWEHHAQFGEAVAGRVVRQIVERWRRLEQFPHSSVAVPELADSVRRIVSGNYVSLLRIEGDVVVILRVLHGKRDLSKLSFEDLT